MTETCCLMDAQDRKGGPADYTRNRGTKKATMSTQAATHNSHRAPRICPLLFPWDGLLFPRGQIVNEQGGSRQVELSSPSTLALCRVSHTLSGVSY